MEGRARGRAWQEFGRSVVWFLIGSQTQTSSALRVFQPSSRSRKRVSTKEHGRSSSGFLSEAPTNLLQRSSVTCSSLLDIVIWSVDLNKYQPPYFPWEGPTRKTCYRPFTRQKAPIALRGSSEGWLLVRFPGSSCRLDQLTPSCALCRLIRFVSSSTTPAQNEDSPGPSVTFAFEHPDTRLNLPS